MIYTHHIVAKSYELYRGCITEDFDVYRTHNTSSLESTLDAAKISCPLRHYTGEWTQHKSEKSIDNVGYRCKIYNKQTHEENGYIEVYLTSL